jgi:hypothetical protein
MGLQDFQVTQERERGGEMEATQTAKLAGVKVGDWVIREGGRSITPCRITRVDDRFAYIKELAIDIGSGRSKINRNEATQWRMAFPADLEEYFGVQEARRALEQSEAFPLASFITEWFGSKASHEVASRLSLDQLRRIKAILEEPRP